MKLISSTLAGLITLSTLHHTAAWAAETDSAGLVQENTVSQPTVPAPVQANATRKAQIVIDAKFIETNAGKQDVLSAPRLTMLEGNKGTIKVVRDLTVALPGAGNEASQTVQIGYNIEATPFMQGDKILLRCNITSSEIVGKPTETTTSAALSTRSLNMAVVLLAEPGKASRFVLWEETSEGKDRRSVAVELTAFIAQLEANAATIYWQAFAAMPKLNQEEIALLALKPGDPLDKAAAEKLVGKLENSLALLNTAGGISECDWGLNLTEGPTLQLPYVPKALELAKAARLRARLRMLEGNTAAPISDLEASLRLAQAAGQPGLLINLLVQTSIEWSAIETIAAQFGKFDKAALQQLASVLSNDDQLPSLKHAIEMEKKCYAGWMHHQIEQSLAKNESLAQAQWVAEYIFPMTNTEAKEARPSDAFFKAIGGNWKGFEKQVMYFEEDYDELARILGLPHGEIDYALGEFIKRLQKNKDTRSLSSLVLLEQVKPYKNAYNRISQVHVERRMLVAAIMNQLEGRPEALKIRDPFGNGPFEIKQDTNGIEIKSQFSTNNKPIARSFITK